MTLRRGVRCHDPELREYAAGRIGPERARDWDHHLVACEACRLEVAGEHRLREALAGGPSMRGDLRLSLLALARDLEPSPVPVAGPQQLPLLAPGHPPCHRSPLRATVVAAAAAGVSAAAAWSLTVLGAPTGRPAVVSGPSSPAVVPATSGSAGVQGTASLVSVHWTARTSPSVPATRRAQSTP